MKTIGTAALIALALVLMAGLSWAQSNPGGAGAAAKAAAQAGAKATPTAADAPKPATSKVAPAADAKAAPADNGPLPDRVNSLEKQNVVLSEDLGKARLDQRLQLEELAKKQAEAIAKLNQQLADQKKKMDEERAKQAKRNRNMWIAVGALALGVAVAH